MSKYYCPECGADLEDQDGFDPEEGVWKCTNCGEVLYGDDIEETMSKFDGVIWYCDSCGAILNKQSGFEDDCGVWRCTECGYKNRISEDEIYDSEEDYQEHKSSTGRNDTFDSEDDCCSNQKIYECPYCGHELNNQFSFDADKETHTCTWCDAQLIKDDDEYKIQYICPHCGAVLNDQWRFQEERYYTCIECGTELYLSENKYVIDDEKMMIHMPDQMMMTIVTVKTRTMIMSMSVLRLKGKKRVKQAKFIRNTHLQRRIYEELFSFS